MIEDLKIIRANAPEKLAIEYHRIHNQECFFKNQGRLSDELKADFENEKAKIVEKALNYNNWIAEEIHKDMEELTNVLENKGSKGVLDRYMKRMGII